MNFLELKNVNKSYGAGKNRLSVLKDINLSIAQGEFVALMGFSGTGKTTIISLISGLLSPDEGEVLFQGKPIKGPGAERGVVFQNYSLLPWLNVYQNVALAVDNIFPDWPLEKRKKHIEKYIAMVNLTPAMSKRPGELSGGMRQRVAVARALAMNPEILLLDEPLSALDALTRGTLQQEIEKIWLRDRKTVVLITNDVDEGILLADRIIPLKPGTGTTLGPAFKIPFERPRRRHSFNNDPLFRRVRNDIVSYFMDLRAETRNHSVTNSLRLPTLRPMYKED